MFSAIRKRLTYANVALTIALVFAMSGGAYAAGKFLITSTKQIKPSVLASLKGKAGANGAPGATGPAGAAGVAGSAGAKGEAGATGSAGAAGPAGPQGPAGAAGKNGTNGKDGSPWAVGGLPPSATETGVWGLTQLANKPGIGEVHIPISFTIPLAAPLSETHVHVIGEGETGAAGKGCGGGSSQEPIAEPGNLCVYIATGSNMTASSFVLNNVEMLGELGAGKTGADLDGIVLPEHASGYGDWAVTAPAE